MAVNKKVVLLTGTELRHEFFRKYIASQTSIDVLATYCESKKGNLVEVVQKDKLPNTLRKQHLSARAQTEKDFFELYCQNTTDQSNPIFITKGEINDQKHVNQIIKHNPDLIISYGCSIIKSVLLSIFQGKFINIHLGLSPYYRGSGTNFWPFVNSELQFIGTTFMYIDKGVDTGKIIHQQRARIFFNDNIHQIGNRLIKDSFYTCANLIVHFQNLEKMDQIEISQKQEKYYRKKDFTEESLTQAYLNLEKGLINQYLAQKEHVDQLYPIIINPAITNP